MSAQLVTMKAIGDWSDRVHVPLFNALQASVETFGKSGYKACEQAIVYMAKSSAAMTKVSPEKRKVVQNPAYKANRKLPRWGFMTYSGSKQVFAPLTSVEYEKYMVRFESATTGEMLVKDMRTGIVHREQGRSRAEKDIVGIRNDKRLKIKNRGLARRSWMWGIKGLSKGPLAGVTDIQSIFAGDDCGLVLIDRLNYILKTVPAGFSETATRKATDSIMAQVARRVEQRFSVEVPRLAAQRQRKAERKLASEFRRAQKAGAL